MSKFKYLYICLFLGFYWYACSFSAYAKEGEIAAEKVLILIDISGSTSKKQPFIEQSLELFYKWLNEEQKQYIEYWIFGDSASKVSYDEYVEKYVNKKGNLEMSTHIADALESVNGEVEKAIEKGEKIYVIVISDLIASEARSSDYTWELVEAEQDKFDEVLKVWKTNMDEGQMDLLFITWGKDKAENLSEIRECTDESGRVSRIIEQKGFRCNVESVFKKSPPICEIPENSDSISGVKIAGGLIEKTAEMMDGIETVHEEKSIKREKHLVLPDEFYKAYIVTGQNEKIYKKIKNKESGKKENVELIPEYKTECIALYCLPTELSKGSSYEIFREDGIPECYIFYENIPKIEISTEPEKLYENDSMKIICSSEDADIAKTFPQLYLQIKTEEGDVIQKEEQLTPDGDGNLITGEFCLKAGKYNITPCVGEGQSMETETIKVKKVATLKDKASMSEKDAASGEKGTVSETENSPEYLIIAVIVGGGTLIIASKKLVRKRKG